MILASVVFSYITNVLIPVRDLINLPIEKKENFNIDELMIEIPGDLLADKIKQSKSIDQELDWNKLIPPMFLKLEENNNSWRVSFNEEKMVQQRDNLFKSIKEENVDLLGSLKSFKLEARGLFRCEKTQEIEGLDYPICEDADLGFYGEIQKIIASYKLKEAHDIDLSSLESKKQELISRAKKLKESLEEKLLSSDDSIKKELILSYIINVPVSIRDILVLTKPYSSNKIDINELMIDVKQSLFLEGSEDYIDLKTGKDVSSDPYRLTLNPVSYTHLTLPTKA